MLELAVFGGLPRGNSRILKETSFISPLQRRASAPDADGAPHCEGRLVQELQREAGLGVRVRHRGQPEVQGGQGHPGEGPRQRAGRHRRRQPKGLTRSSTLVKWLSPFCCQVL